MNEDLLPTKVTIDQGNLIRRVIRSWVDEFSVQKLRENHETMARGWGPQGILSTGGDGLVRVPNLRGCKHFFMVGVAHAGEEGRINVLPWYRLVGVATPVRRKDEEPCCPQG